MQVNPKPTVLFLDLVGVHCALEDELIGVFRRALRSATFVDGQMVEQFESDFATWLGAKYCAGVGSGTDALRFALMAAGVQDGVVVTVPNTFIATTEAISQAGAVPEFVDIDEQTYTMDPRKLREYLEGCEEDGNGGLLSRRTGRRVVAVVPVHLYGHMADMDPILELAGRYGLAVIEDACQAHGAEYFSRKLNAWKKAGSMGRAAAFSFYPGKNLGACGEGGAVTTNDENICRHIRMLRTHGQAKKYYHELEGYNGRLDAIQAGILTAKLRYLPEWNQKRRDVAARYRNLLGACEAVILPHEAATAKTTYHLFVIRSKDRDGLMAHLARNGIGTAIHYPVPLHLQNAYRHLDYHQGDYPAAERACREILSLPMYPQLELEQQRRVAESISAFDRSAPLAFSARAV